MTVSSAKRVSIAKYQQEKCDRVTADIPKGKREAYKMIAAEKGLSLSQLIQNSVESFAGLVPEKFTTECPPEKFTPEQRRLVEEFNQLSVDAQKYLIKTLKAINQSKGGGDND